MGKAAAVNFWYIPGADPYAGQTGDAEIALYFGSLPIFYQLFGSNIVLFHRQFCQGTHDVGKAHLLRTDRHAASASGTVPEQVGTEDALLKPHAYHVNDLARVEFGNGLADGTGPAAGPAGKTGV